MKRLTCEMCGSTDLLKQNGVFVCQSCGCQYSIEEAKKLLVEVEGTVSVQGTVQIDKTSEVQKHLANARRALAKEDWDDVVRYYNLVEENDPTDIEAIFYSTYGKAKQTLTSDDFYKREQVFKSLIKSISIIDDNFNLAKEQEQKEIIIKISQAILDMASSAYVYTEVRNGYGELKSDNSVKTRQLFNDLQDEFVRTIQHIITKYTEKSATKYLYEIIVEQSDFILKNGQLAHPENFTTIKYNALLAIEGLDPSNQSTEEYCYPNPTEIFTFNFARIVYSVILDAKSLRMGNGGSMECYPYEYITDLICSDNSIHIYYDKKEIARKKHSDGMYDYVLFSEEDIPKANKMLYELALRINYFKQLHGITFFTEEELDKMKELGEPTPPGDIWQFSSASGHTYEVKLTSDSITIDNKTIQFSNIAGLEFKKFMTGDYMLRLKLKDEYLLVTAFASPSEKDELEAIYLKIKDSVPDVSKKTGGCYIATSVYGSYDCPQVWTLRRYRDEVLGSTWYGRLFIKVYYAISPTLVKWFGKTKWFQKMWKGKLDKMVGKLNAKGFDDTPYQDKNWR